MIHIQYLIPVNQIQLQECIWTKNTTKNSVGVKKKLI